MQKMALVFISLLASLGFAALARAQTELIYEPPLAEPPAEASPSREPIIVGGEELAPLDRQDHLERWLEYLSRNVKRGRVTSGATVLVAGGLTMGFGIGAFLQDRPDNELTKGAGLLTVAASGVFMAFGICQLAIKSEPEEMLHRWRRAAAGQMTRQELSRFEGELRQYSQAAKRTLRAGRWTNFGMALTGALILGITPAADLSSDGSTIGYVTGGAALGAGLLGFAFSFVGQSGTDYWGAYVSGKRPPSRSRWSAAPEVGRTFAGLRVQGHF